MPFLQGGTFYATIAGSDDKTVRPVAFTYYPLVTPLAVLLALFLLYKVRQLTK